jgi:hypothetical protein
VRGEVSDAGGRVDDGAAAGFVGFHDAHFGSSRFFSRPDEMGWGGWNGRAAVSMERVTD